MGKYNSGIIYKGNLMKYVNGMSILFKNNILLIYDDKIDAFYSLIDILNFQLSKDLDNLNEKEKEECQKIIDKNTFHYTCRGRNGEIYVDEKSIELEIAYEDKKGNTK